MMNGGTNSFVSGSLPAALALLLLAAALTGCGGNGGIAPATPEEQLVYSFLRGIVDGDAAAVLDALPPQRLEEIRADMPHATEEELGQVFLGALRSRFPYTAIKQLSFRTETMDGSTADVYYWGVFEKRDASGGARKVTVREGEAGPFNVITVDGVIYLNV